MRGGGLPGPTGVVTWRSESIAISVVLFPRKGRSRRNSSIANMMPPSCVLNALSPHAADAQDQIPARRDPSLLLPASRGNQQRKPRRDFLHAAACADCDFRADRQHNRDESGEQRGEDEQNLLAPAADREPGRRVAAGPRAASGACAREASLRRIEMRCTLSAARRISELSVAGVVRSVYRVSCGDGDRCVPRMPYARCSVALRCASARQRVNVLINIFQQI